MPARSSAQLSFVVDGRLSVREVHQRLQPVLQRPTPANSMEVYNAFADWTWTALHRKQTTTALRQRRDMILEVADLYRAGYRMAHERLITLAELLQRSIDEQTTKSVKSAIKKLPLIPILEALETAGKEGLTASALASRLQIGMKETTTYLPTCIALGQVRKEYQGGVNNYHITEMGMATLERP